MFTLYSTQFYTDLKYILLSSIAQAKTSLFLASYGFGDRDLMRLIEEKADEEVDVEMVYDKSYPPRISSKKVEKIKDDKSGLMHRKITIIDGDKIFLGSTNSTEQSLVMHENLLLYMEDQKLADSIRASTLYRGEKFTYFPLPEKSSDALSELVDLIDMAKKSITVAMFTFTHMDIAEKLIAAKNRGVEVRLIVDWISARGSSSKVVSLLHEHGIKVHTQLEKCLFHHKCAMIDDDFVMGSVNWTKSGFKRNREYMLIFHGLDGDDLNVVKHFFDESWHLSKKLRISKIPVKRKSWRIPYFPSRSLYSYLWTP